jgi:isoquinoline 1-oxidoreductase beta subunit
MVYRRDGNRHFPYGDLADAAGRRRPPRLVRLKSPDQFVLIGTSPNRLDLPAKIDGSTAYAVDVQRPGMLTASVAHPPVLGSEPTSVQDSDAMDQPGVRQVVQLPHLVAVLADSWWEAERGRQALSIDWSAPNRTADSNHMQTLLAEALTSGGTVARSEGRIDRALERAALRIDARYSTPYLAHATMEPMSCVADVRDDQCEVWVPTQNQAGALTTAARVAQLPQDRVAIHTTMAGGGFGRRLYQDFVEEAVALSKAAGAPVKVVWTREDDILHDFFKPMTAHRIEGSLDANGQLSTWHHQIAGGFGTDGAHDLAYDIRNVHVEYRRPSSTISEGLWRSVDFSHNCFVVESFVDELANLAEMDPYRFRRDLLGDAPRHRAVLDRVAEVSDWGASKPGIAQGLALTASHGSVVGQVVELSNHEGVVRVHRIVAVVDCGIVVHPDNARAQIEGAIAMGLSAALREQVTFEGGRIDARNFDRYQLLRMPEMPRVDVHFISSEDAPGGIGEVGVPPVAPAIGNAIFQATGQRIRQLPYLSGGRLQDY